MHGVTCNISERDGDKTYVTSFLCDRSGKIIGKYRKSHNMPDEDMDLGNDLPVFDTDFGKIAMRVGSDRYFADIDHVYTAKGADILFFSTQDWGPDALHRNLRGIFRCMDAQMLHVQATHSRTETMHRSIIIDPCGVPVARSRYMKPGIVSAVIDLDNDRPRRYVRNFKPHTPKGYLPQYQPTEFPEVRNDLKETILQQRRPELYQILLPKQKTSPPKR